jgi:large conductance mechanosensitive channel
MSIIKEFKTFAMKGNMIDMAVGIIIGAAFGKIVNSLVNDVIMPPLGKMISNVDFTNLFLVLGPGEFATVAAAKEAGVATLNYGTFINEIINFLIVAIAVFMMIKAINTMKKKEAAAPTLPPAPTNEEKLLAEIRDVLKSKS